MEISRNQNSKMHSACQLVGILGDALSVFQHTPGFKSIISGRGSSQGRISPDPIKCRNCLDSPNIAVLLNGRFPKKFPRIYIPAWSGAERGLS